MKVGVRDGTLGRDVSAGLVFEARQDRPRYL
jgi:hypothetical protein